MPTSEMILRRRHLNEHQHSSLKSITCIRDNGSLSSTYTLPKEHNDESLGYTVLDACNTICSDLKISSLNEDSSSDNTIACSTMNQDGVSSHLSSSSTNDLSAAATCHNWCKGPNPNYPSSIANTIIAAASTPTSSCEVYSSAGGIITLLLAIIGIIIVLMYVVKHRRDTKAQSAALSKFKLSHQTSSDKIISGVSSAMEKVGIIKPKLEPLLVDDNDNDIVMTPAEKNELKISDIEHFKYTTAVLKLSSDFHKAKTDALSQIVQETDTDNNPTLVTCDEIKDYEAGLKELRILLDEEALYKKNQLSRRIAASAKQKKKQNLSLDQLSVECDITKAATLRALELYEEETDVTKKRMDLTKKKKTLELTTSFFVQKKEARNVITKETQELLGSLSSTKSSNKVLPTEDPVIDLDSELDRLRKSHLKEAKALEEVLRIEKETREKQLGERLKARRARVEELLRRKEKEVGDEDGGTIEEAEEFKRLVAAEEEEKNELELEFELDDMATNKPLDIIIQDNDNVIKTSEDTIKNAALQEHSSRISQLQNDHEADKQLLQDSLMNEHRVRESKLKERLRKKKENALAIASSEEEVVKVTAEIQQEEIVESEKLQKQLESEKQFHIESSKKKQLKELSTITMLARMSASTKAKGAKREAAMQASQLERMQKEHLTELTALQKELLNEKNVKGSKLQERLRKKKEIEALRVKQAEKERAMKEAADEAAVEALAATAAYSAIEKETVTTTAAGDEMVRNNEAAVVPQNFEQTLTKLLTFDSDFSMEHVHVIEAYAKMMRKNLKH